MPIYKSIYTLQNYSSKVKAKYFFESNKILRLFVSTLQQMLKEMFQREKIWVINLDLYKEKKNIEE